LAKKGDLEARRKLLGILRGEKVVAKLLEMAKDRFKNRNCGYTIVLKAGFRNGDCAPRAVVTLVTENEVKASIGPFGPAAHKKVDRSRRVAASRATSESHPALSPESGPTGSPEPLVEPPVAAASESLSEPLVEPPVAAPESLVGAQEPESSPSETPESAPEPEPGPGEDEK
jgi:hypothetical protein